MLNGVSRAMMVAGTAARASSTAPAKGEVEGFTLEIPDEFGQTQAVLEGAKASFEPTGVIQLQDVKATIHQKDKSTIQVASPKALYHRSSKVVTTEEPVRVDSKDTRITGRGLVWEPEKSKIFIRQNVKVVMRNLEKDSTKGPVISR